MTYIIKNKRKWNNKRRREPNKKDQALTISNHSYNSIILAFKKHGFFLTIEKRFIEKLLNNILRVSSISTEAKEKNMEDFKGGDYDVLSNNFFWFLSLRWDNPDRSLANKMVYIASQRSIDLPDLLKNILAPIVYENAKVW